MRKIPFLQYIINLKLGYTLTDGEKKLHVRHKELSRNSHIWFVFKIENILKELIYDLRLFFMYKNVYLRILND